MALAASVSPAGIGHVRYGEGLRRTAGGATLISDGARVDPAQAALVNGGLIHSLEYDDTHTASIVHGSSVILPVAMALAEVHRLSGTELVRLYLLGYEALIRIGLAAPGAFQRTGFQVTSAGGALVAAAMAANAAGLHEDRAVAAIGIALSQASGAMEFLSNGSSAKSVNPGWAAHSGIIAARLAASGITGPETAIEGKFGAMAIFSGGAASGALPDFASIGTTWHMRDVAMKFHPACHYLHAFIEAATQLRTHIPNVDEIAEIMCHVPAGAAAIICEPWEAKISPASGHAIRWSLPVTVAMALCGDTLGLDAFERLPTEAERRIAGRIAWQPFEETRFPACYDAMLQVTFRDGQTHEIRVGDAYGNASRPARPTDIEAKFMANAGRKLRAESAAALAGRLAGLMSIEAFALSL